MESKNTSKVRFKIIMLFVLVVFVGVFRISPVNATDGTNNSHETAIELVPGQQISTSIDFKGDQDWYKINVSDTSSIASTISNNSGGVWYELYDESLNRLHVTLVESLTKTDSWKVNQGVYYIKISDFSGVNYLTSSITLKIGIIQEDQWENNDTAERAVELTTGQQLTGISIEAINDYDWFKINVATTSSIASTITNNSGNLNYELYDESLNKLMSKYIYPNKTQTYSWKVEPGVYYIKLSHNSSIDHFISTLTLKVDIIQEDQWENNDTAERAVELTTGQQLTGISIESINDYDWFKINVTSTSSIASAITNNSGNLNYELYDESLNKIMSNYIYSNKMNTISWKVEPGVYYIKLSHNSSIDHFISTLTLKVDIIQEDQWENNDITERATEIKSGQKLENISIEAKNDEDWFKIRVDHDGKLITYLANNNGYVKYTIYDSEFNQLVIGSVGSSAPEIKEIEITSGLYYIKFNDYTSVDYLNNNITLRTDIVYDFNLLTTLGNRIFNFFVSDPVNAATGNFTYYNNDINIPTRGIPLEFTRYYNSREGYSGPLGKGWQHNYNTFITVNADGSVSVFYPDGHSVLFLYENGQYTRSAGTFETLNKNIDGTYTLTFKDQTKYLYGTDGKLVSITDKNNNSIVLQYNNSLLTTVTEPTGRTLQFTYNQNNLLTQIIDSANRTINFTYDASGNLVTYQDLNGGITTYSYGTYGLVQIADPRNNVLVNNVYDSESRVIEQEDGKANKTYFSYDSINKKNQVTDPRGNITTFYYDDKYRVTQITYPNNTTSLYTYDSDYNLVSETDQNGNTFTYTYDSIGNLLTKTDPVPLNYVYTYTYDSFNNPIKIIDAAGYETNYTYDINGNLLTASRNVYGGTAINSFGYNQYGQIISITDPNNKTTQFTYNEYGYKQSEIDPLGNITTYTYDIIGRILTKTDPRGNLLGANPADYTWTYTYDANGNILTTTDPLGNVVTNTYDANNNLISTTDSKNNTTTFAYDQNNRLTMITDSLNNITTYTYDGNGNKISTTDARGKITTYTYDKLNRLISVTDPMGFTESYTLDGKGNKLSFTDKNSNTSTYTYDVLNRLITTTDSLGGDIIYQYDPLGNIISQTDQRGNTTTYNYDQNSKLLSITDASNYTTSYSYDLSGNQLSVTNAKGAIWQYTYDAKNRIVEIREPLGNISKIEYDSIGNKVKEIDANNVTTNYSYDALNRLVTVTNALNNTTTYIYDVNSNLIQLINAKGNITTYNYDALNRLISQTDPLNNITQTEYDAVGNIIRTIKPDGSIINYNFDNNNRLIKIVYPDLTEITYLYDNAGNRISMTDSSGTSNYTYSVRNELTTVTKDVYSINYEYDLAGNITELIYPDGQSVTYTYNELNKPVTVTDDVYSLTISYDEVGNIKQEILPNNYTVNYQYDLNENLTVTEHVYGGYILTKSAYTLDNVGNRLSMTDEHGNVTYYNYDNLYQLINVHYPDGTTVDYIYDSVGNRLSENETLYSYNAADQLIQVDDIIYQYDVNGNLLSVGNNIFYEYDYNNRLTSTTDNSKTILYSYDGDGNRTKQTVTDDVYGMTEFNYIYDINTGIPQLLVEMDSAGNENNYLYAGRLYSSSGSKGTLYYHQDGLGSITAITHINGQSLNQYSYDAFGKIIASNETVDNIFGYTGEIYDDNGLLYLRARYYDPTIGRFLGKDTYMGQLNDPLSLNLYAYVGNNPVLYIDPTGHFGVSSGLDALQLGLDGVGLFPGWFGVAADGVNGLIYSAQGDTTNAALSYGALIPVVGNASTLGKYGVKYGDEAAGIIEGTSKTVDDILEGATPGRVTKGKATQFEMPGGFNQALDDFNNMGVTDIKDIPGGKVGKLPDGRTINVRTNSSDGRATLEIYDGKNSIKIRYND